FPRPFPGPALERVPDRRPHPARRGDRLRPPQRGGGPPDGLDRPTGTRELPRRAPLGRSPLRLYRRTLLVEEVPLSFARTALDGHPRRVVVHGRPRARRLTSAR